jgi:hypothetical protein
MRTVNRNFRNPHEIHLKHETPEQIRDAFLHIKWQLKKSGWDTEDLTALLGIARPTWYAYGHKLESKGYRKIPAEQLDLLRLHAAVAGLRRFDSAFAPSFMPPRNEWTVGGEKTTSFLAAVYLSGVSGDQIVSGPENTKDHDMLLEKSAQIIAWFDVARQASRAQIARATNLGDYDIGRIGFITANWGIEPLKTYTARLEKIVGEKELAA